jgi:hypothetical protein
MQDGQSHQGVRSRSKSIAQDLLIKLHDEPDILDWQSRQRTAKRRRAVHLLPQPAQKHDG